MQILKTPCAVLDYAIVWDWVPEDDSITSFEITKISGDDDIVVFGETVADVRTTNFCLSGGTLGSVYSFKINIVCAQPISGATVREECRYFTVAINKK